MIGGGARNAAALPADGRRHAAAPVLAGPVEATALGNVLVQARAAGELGSLAEMRAVAAASARPASSSRRRPRGRRGDYRRFLDVTGLRTPATVDRPGGAT